MNADKAQQQGQGEWTQDAPTTSGWYWYWGERMDGPALQRVVKSWGEVHIVTYDGWRHIAYLDGVWWLGPITPPEPPMQVADPRTPGGTGYDGVSGPGPGE